MSKLDPTSEDAGEAWLTDGDEDWSPHSTLSEFMKLKSTPFWKKSVLQSARQNTFLALSLIYVGLWLVATLFWIASWTGGSQLYKLVEKWMGYSAPNWLDHTIFDKRSNAVIASALPILGGAPTTISHKHLGRGYPTTRLFSLPLARTFLLMSAIVYEKNDDLLVQAASARDEDEARRLYKASHIAIKKQAAQWGMKWDVVSTLPGLFASAFQCKIDAVGDPYIVLVFKGTSAVSFAEILVDASILRVPSSAFFGPGSTAHEGFYDALFPSNAGGADGYSDICSFLKELAYRMRKSRTNANNQDPPPIPLWVTGHSLGSALASLIFARFVHSPGDLGDDIVLRDCYSYGTPRIGDSAFAAGFERHLTRPIDRPNILWRIVNNFDAVCQVPPGLGDDDYNRASLGAGVLNYAHIGTQVQLSPIFKPFFTINSAYFRTDSHSLLQDSARPADSGKIVSSRLHALRSAGWNPLRIAICLLPSIAFDHFPASYLCRLNQIDAAQQKDLTEEEQLVLGQTSSIGGNKKGLET